MNILEVDNICKTYGKGRTTVSVLQYVSFKLNRGEIGLIMGPSGSGKTTLLSIIGCLLTPSSGRVILCDREVTAAPFHSLSEVRLRHVGFVFQSFNLLQSLTASENVQMRLVLAGIRKKAKQRSDELLTRLGLGKRLDHLPEQLSGGEKQRVSIARALVGEADIILADEPTGNLDSKAGREVVEILREMAKERNCGVIIVTHDHRIEDIADWVLYLEDGRLKT